MAYLSKKLNIYTDIATTTIMQKFNPEYVLTPKGLPNVMKIHCYWNSVMQVLLSSTAFTQKILELDACLDIGRKSFIHDFAKFIRGDITNMQIYNKYIQSLHIIGKDKQLLNQIISNQQCASETFTYVLEIFEKSKQITYLFQHRYIQSLLCVQCKYLSNSKIHGLIFEINPDHIIPDSLFELTEKIEDYKCEKCQSTTPKQKLYKLVMVPEIIPITIKKYVWMENGGKKTNEVTTLPEYITIDKLKYRAVAYVNHYGRLDFGHYITTALRRDGEGLSWFEFNDDIVTKTIYAPDQHTYMITYNYCE